MPMTGAVDHTQLDRCNTVAEPLAVAVETLDHSWPYFVVVVVGVLQDVAVGDHHIQVVVYILSTVVVVVSLRIPGSQDAAAAYVEVVLCVNDKTYIIQPMKK